MTWRWIVQAGSATGAVDGDVIIVLGAEVLPSGPCPELASRLWHAKLLYERGAASKIVCSGGASENLFEAQVMARTLRAWGVPATAIFCDNTGTSTRATIRSAAERAEGRIIFASSPYHLRRIGIEAHRWGLDHVCSAASVTPITANAHARRQQMAREVFALTWYSITARCSPQRRAVAGASARRDRDRARVSKSCATVVPQFAPKSSSYLPLQSGSREHRNPHTDADDAQMIEDVRVGAFFKPDRLLGRAQDDDDGLGDGARGGLH
jgi:uncharacterized SAM-binding protein YcdF (DUF218 family)